MRTYCTCTGICTYSMALYFPKKVSRVTAKERYAGQSPVDVQDTYRLISGTQYDPVDKPYRSVLQYTTQFTVQYQYFVKYEYGRHEFLYRYVLVRTL